MTGPGSPRETRTWPTRGARIYCVGVLVALAAGAPWLIAARSGVPFPRIIWDDGLPEAVLGIYFFTAIALIAGFLAARLRHRSLLGSLLLALIGLAGFETIYGIGYALLQGDPGLLLPRAGLPLSGWPGYATWVVVEAFAASLAIGWWPSIRFDRWVGLATLGFLGGMIAWDVVFALGFPPHANSSGVLFVNTFTEVSGSLILPLACSGRSPAALPVAPNGAHPGSDAVVPMTPKVDPGSSTDQNS
jgi:hypothetical protein